MDLILKPTLIPIPIELEHEPPMLDIHISLLENECELQFYDLDETYKPTLTLEPKLDLSFILELISIRIPFIVESKSSISQNHISLLDQGLAVMISQD